MPLYEYECPEGHKFEKIRPIDQRNDPIHCQECHGLARLLISKTHWYMGWKFLKGLAEKSPPAPNDAGYHPEWDDL